ncbi:transducin-like enhancer protein 2 isoform X1 [Podarcis raffonei]|uniref:transducin-like enhancer protein 2 isoform X1 n=1 Tax=Podarcis raffonei TaxID=65483 RepID=UPI00232948BC|nr:transducin-like enhancer protein 2 isoform X1 [Podarcis raffonei]
MYPQGRHASGQPFKFSVLEICDRIKEEFQFLQAQYHSLKLECEKLASEKTEMQRHYVMYYEMSYGLNIEMHKQAEIVKRLSAICAQIIPFLTQEHQQQVLQAMDRAKQVTMGELNSIIGQQLQNLSHHAPPIPLTPHPSGPQTSNLVAVSTSSGLLALSGVLAAQTALAAKEERSSRDSENHQGKWRWCVRSKPGLAATGCTRVLGSSSPLQPRGHGLCSSGAVHVEGCRFNKRSLLHRSNGGQIESRSRRGTSKERGTKKNCIFGSSVTQTQPGSGSYRPPVPAEFEPKSTLPSHNCVAV